MALLALPWSLSVDEKGSSAHERAALREGLHHSELLTLCVSRNLPTEGILLWLPQVVSAFLSL